MPRAVLYSTQACHLCEAAEALLEGLRRERPGFAWEVVDISDDDRLFERYGLRIPVLRCPGGVELNWPFTAEDLHRALQQERLR